MTKTKYINGQIIKGVGGRYSVKTEDGTVLTCCARGKLRSGDLYVGDYVNVEVFGKINAIQEVLPRQSMLVRPYISNIDGILIVIAPLPKPDFLLIDKLIISCIQQEIDGIICINKSDLPESQKLYDKVVSEYGSQIKIIKLNSQDNDAFNQLKELIKGKYYCLAGQSAVGKSTMINNICGREVMQVGELSEKSERGKNTTRHIQIIDLGDNTKIADTCGFSMFEIPLFDPMQLSGYYTDFDKYRDKCKYRGCTHTVEEQCGVKTAVNNGEIPKDRYERYLQMYKDFTKRWEKRYD